MVVRPSRHLGVGCLVLSATSRSKRAREARAALRLGSALNWKVRGACPLRLTIHIAEFQLPQSRPYFIFRQDKTFTRAAAEAASLLFHSSPYCTGTAKYASLAPVTGSVIALPVIFPLSFMSLAVSRMAE